jgi:hypothetical protein
MSIYDSIIPVIETLVNQFQDSKTQIRDANVIAEDLIIIDLNTIRLRKTLRDVSDVEIPEMSITSLIGKITDNADYLQPMYNNYVNLRKTYDNRTSIGTIIGNVDNITYYRNIIDTSANAVIANKDLVSTSEMGINKVIQYGDNVNTFRGYANTFVALMERINTCKTTVAQISAAITNTQQRAQFDSETTIIRDSGFVDDIITVVRDVSNYPFVNIQDSSSNFLTIQRTIVNDISGTRPFYDSVAPFQSYKNAFGILRQLTSQQGIIS